MPSLNAIRGKAWKFGDSVDTTQMAGGGIRVSDDPKENLRANCLRGIRPDFTENVKPGDIVVAGSNFGCGSSRQTAVEALQYCGVTAVLAETVARIHMRNSIALALPTFVVPGISEMVHDGDEIEVDYPRMIVRNLTTEQSLPLRKFPDTVEQIYDAGGISQVIAKKLAERGITPPAAATV